MGEDPSANMNLSLKARFCLLLLLTVVFEFTVHHGAVLGTVHASDPEWELISDQEGIKTWRKEISGSPMIAFRGESVIDASMARIGQVLSDSAKQVEWIEKCAEGKTVRQINDFERIEYHRIETPIVISDRDFVYHVRTQFDVTKKILLVKLKSVEDPLVPETSKNVRGRLINSA
jgi:hypothetical protein